MALQGARATASTITHILNFGTAWTVKLSCGCARKGLIDTDLKREQFYIGKAVQCDNHERNGQRVTRRSNF